MARFIFSGRQIPAFPRVGIAHQFHHKHSASYGWWAVPTLRGLFPISSYHFFPLKSLISWIKGRNSAMTMKPITNPKNTTNSG